MSKRFLLFTTFVFTFITLTEAFQVTKLFSSKKIDTMSSEQTFIAVKPDGVMRGLVGEIIARFEKRGYSTSILNIVKLMVTDSNLLR